MDISGKVWGSTSKIFSKNNVEVCRITGKKYGASSTHTHTSKMSLFFVERGAIKVIVEKNDYDLTDETILQAGESTIVKPNEYHSFEILKDDTIVYEFYWVELDPDDIDRRDCGSIQPE